MISPEDGQSQWRPEDPSWLVRCQLWVHERRGCSGLLLTVIAFPIIGGTSNFGGKATIVGSYLGCYIIGMIEAGLVATGMQGFWVRAVVGLVFLAAVVFHLTMEDPTRLRRFRQLRLPGLRRPAPQVHEPH
jgi:simple sugar transport system permease protein